MKKKFSCFFIFCLLFTFVSFSLVSGFGISPPLVKEKNLLPGSVLEKQIRLYMSPFGEDTKVGFMVEDGDTKDWVKIIGEDELFFPANQNYFDLTIMVLVPESAKLGEFKQKGVFTFNVKDPKYDVPSSNVKFIAQVELNFDLGVTNKIVRNYKFVNANVARTKEKEKIRPNLYVKNNGNVKAFPTKINVEVLDQLKTKVLYSYDVKIKDEHLVEPFSERYVQFEMPNKLPPGYYWLRFNMVDEEMALNSVDDIVLDVLPNPLLTLTITNPLVIIALVVLLILVFYAAVRRFKHVRPLKHTKHKKN